MAKLWRIIKSRFKTETSEDWVKERRKVCNECEFNSLNSTDTNIKLKMYKLVSDFYTFLTRSKNENLGECTICGCDLFYKSREEEEKCDKNKWKSIYIPNKKCK